MIKAEVIEHDGVEVPNWVHKCKDVLTSAPTIGTVAILIVAVSSIVLWQHQRSVSPVSNTTTVQSIPAADSELKVITSTPGLNVSPSANSAESTSATPITTSPNGSSIPSNSNRATSLGPASVNSLNSLQPSGSSQQPGGLTQAAGQTVQSAGNAVNSALNNLGL